MAHVLLPADQNEVYRHIYTAVFEADGHQVTAPRDFWGVLAVLRSTLHPLVVVYGCDDCAGHLLGDEERMAALEANLSALRRHRYVAIAWVPGPLPPRLAAIEDALDVEMLVRPFGPHDLHAAVRCGAEQFP